MEFETIDNKEEKEKVAKKMAKRVVDGDIIGFGSGTTAFLTAIEIGKKIKEQHLKIVAIPASKKMENLCKELGISITTLDNASPNWSFDGADEVDEDNWLIKGKGSAMFREKLNIINCKENYILVDKTKLVRKIGEKNSIPVECYPDSIKYVEKELKKLGVVEVLLRKENNSVVITDSGNYILDVKFEKINESLEKDIKKITGVIESGLFIGYNFTLVVA